MNRFAVAIFGPTGVGKTSLSLKIAKDCGEIISVDSRQVYKFMDIGTAKPSSDEMQSVPHHLIDIINPNEVITAGLFKRLSEKIIYEILDKGKIPFLVGGTGLYFNALINGLSNIPPVSEKTKKMVVE
ncbi:MAG TPA: isopentenyl transferase family protein, partial [Spirochaetota bacterium]|nr:isopentenyl transferase family protein [Spirochaetota bacterium]